MIKRDFFNIIFKLIIIKRYNIININSENIFKSSRNSKKKLQKAAPEGTLFAAFVLCQKTIGWNIFLDFFCRGLRREHNDDGC